MQILQGLSKQMVTIESLWLSVKKAQSRKRGEREVVVTSTCLTASEFLSSTSLLLTAIQLSEETICTGQWFSVLANLFKNKLRCDFFVILSLAAF